MYEAIEKGKPLKKSCLTKLIFWAPSVAQGVTMSGTSLSRALYLYLVYLRSPSARSLGILHETDGAKILPFVYLLKRKTRNDDFCFHV